MVSFYCACKGICLIHLFWRVKLIFFQDLAFEHNRLFLRTFGEAHYGFALPTNSPYTAPLSIELLELRNKGEIARIIDKWMIDRTPCKALDEDDTTGTLILLNMVTSCGREETGVGLNTCCRLLYCFVSLETKTKRNYFGFSGELFNK